MAKNASTPGATDSKDKRATRGYHNSDEFYFYLQALFTDRAAIGPELLLPSLGWAAVVAWRDRSEPHRFLLIWAILPVVLFTFFPSRIPSPKSGE